jgi:glycosyltransferase involved in cell wall biosynthesis
MRIAVNTRLLLKGKLEGIGIFTFENFKRMCKNHPEHDFIFIFDRAYDDSFIFSDNIEAVVVGPQARHPLLYLIWFELSIPRILKKYKADIFISPDGFIPLRSIIKTISVIHDLNFEHYPEFVTKTNYLFYKTFMPKYAKKAHHIISVSNFSKNDIIDLYNIKEEKISVAYNGISEEFQLFDKEIKMKTKAEFSDSKDYFLYLGAIHPRKNLARLLKAFDKFKTQCESDAKMLIVGKKMFKNKELQSVYESLKFKEDIIFTGYLDIDKLTRVLSSAIALTFVPIFEGFGIPIVEAFASGTAVITSNRTSMPEVASDAAIIVDPFNVDEISDAMIKVYQDTAFRENLISKGLNRLKIFDWDKSSEKIMQIIEEVAD